MNVCLFPQSFTRCEYRTQIKNRCRFQLFPSDMTVRVVDVRNLVLYICYIWQQKLNTNLRSQKQDHILIRLFLRSPKRFHRMAKTLIARTKGLLLRYYFRVYFTYNFFPMCGSHVETSILSVRTTYFAPPSGPFPVGYLDWFCLCWQAFSAGFCSADLNSLCCLSTYH